MPEKNIPIRHKTNKPGKNSAIKTSSKVHQRDNSSGNIIRINKKQLKKSHSFRLFSLPSFLEGIKCSFDIYGNNHHYNFDENLDRDTLKAIHSDYLEIVKDIKKCR